MVRCRDNSLYCGIATDLEDRVREHNLGIGAKYTAIRKPVALAYSERHVDIAAARKREEQVKKWSRSKKEQLIVGFPRRGSE